MRDARHHSSRFPALTLPAVLWIGLALAGCQGDNGTAPGPAPSTTSFRALGDLPGGDFHSEALAVSDDGHVVVGRSSSARFTEEGFAWSGADTLTPLLGAGGVPVASEPRWHHGQR
jgi:probable HAF family extracellular repeat protein